MRMKTIKNRALATAVALDARPGYAIAAEAGIPAQHLSGFISGRMEPSTKNREAVAAALGMSVHELFD